VPQTPHWTATRSWLTAGIAALVVFAGLTGWGFSDLPLVFGFSAAAAGVAICILLPPFVRPHWRTWWLLVSIASVLSLTAFGGVLWWTFLGEAPQELAINRPGPDARVDRVLDVSGSVSDLRDGETVWILVAGGSDNAPYYPQPGPCIVDDEAWTCNDITVGSETDTNLTFDVVAIRANSEQTRDLVRRQGATFARIPDGAQQAERRVVRR
jgi:hypothetical protein